jgi:DNA-binding winged helix-turn-helix (wHTH) protein/tetratricopeptide (TPR) repeat protein
MLNFDRELAAALHSPTAGNVQQAAGIAQSIRSRMDDLLYSPRRRCAVSAMSESICMTVLSHRQHIHDFKRPSIFAQSGINSPMSLASQGLATFDEYELDRARWQLSWRGDPISLNRKTFDLLLYLVDRRERVVGKEELLQALWPEQFIEESNLTQHIFLLRKALSRHSSGEKMIETVPGRGYRFIASVVESTPAPSHLTIGARESITRITIEQDETEDEIGAETNRSQDGSTLRWQPFVVAGTAAIVLLLAGWFGLQHWLDRTGGAPVQVVLVPLEGTTGDSVLDQSLTQALRMDLGQSPYVTIVPIGTVQATLGQMMRKPGDPMTPPVAREVCERTDSQTVLSGNIAKVGRHFLLTEEADSCVNGAAIASAKYEATGLEDLPHGIDKLASTLRRELGESRRSISRFDMPLFHDNTPSLDALKAFTHGTQDIREGKMPDAIALLKTALAADPQFASAQYNLAVAYSSAGDDLHTREEIAKAYLLKDRAMKPTQLAIIAMYDSEATGDMYDLLRNFENWRDLYPNSSQAWSGLANIQRGLAMNREALLSSERTVQLLPHNQGMQANLALDQMINGDLQGARATCERAIAGKLDGDGIRVRYLQVAYVLHDQALLQAQRAWGREHPQAVQVLGEETAIAMAEGRFVDARKLTEQVRDVHRQQGITGPDDEMTKFQAVNLMESGDIEEGKKLFQQSPVDPEEGQEIVGLVYIGDIAAARTAMRANEIKYPKSTMFQLFWLPRIRAEIALREHRPHDAVAALEIARPLGHIGLYLPWLRGRAYLAAGQPMDAEKEFRDVVDHPNFDPTEPTVSLSWLGLGEALAAESNRTAAIEAYQHFFTLWAHADPDAMYLKQAQQEFAKLQLATPAKESK